MCVFFWGFFFSHVFKYGLLVGPDIILNSIVKWPFLLNSYLNKTCCELNLSEYDSSCNTQTY